MESEAVLISAASGARTEPILTIVLAMVRLVVNPLDIGEDAIQHHASFEFLRISRAVSATDDASGEVTAHGGGGGDKPRKHEKGRVIATAGPFPFSR